jgi:hypothetical protein
VRIAGDWGDMTIYIRTDMKSIPRKCCKCERFSNVCGAEYCTAAKKSIYANDSSLGKLNPDTGKPHWCPLVKIEAK